MDSGAAFMVAGLLAMVVAFGMVAYVLRRTQAGIKAAADAASVGARAAEG